MKKLMILPLLSVATALCMPPLWAELNKGVGHVYAAEVNEFDDAHEVSEAELADEAKQYMDLVNELETVTDKYAWYMEFEELMSNCNDPMESIYDYYSDEELILLFRVVEAEVGDLGGFDERCNVASVIFNRLSEWHPDGNLFDVLTKKQFSTISNGRYQKVEVSEETIAACEFVFRFGDTTNGALFFESGSNNVHDAYATYIFRDAAGHKFYK